MVTTMESLKRSVGTIHARLSRRKNALALLWVCVFSNAVIIFQWYFWGYSLAFSATATNGFIGNLRHFGLQHVMADPSPGSPLIPDLLYSFYQLEFCCVTVAILMGAVAERGRVMPAMVFAFLWATLVYCPVACWGWNVNGWGFKWGVLDYAGGGPVEIGSGVGGLAFSWVLGRRKQSQLMNFRPHNVSLVVLGTFMLWFGWLGFNAGSAFGANLRAVLAAWNTNITAAFAGVTWCLLDFRLERKFTMVGFCSGTIAGLVAATPASGFITLWVVLSLVSSPAQFKYLIGIDDALDLFAEHAIGGILGLLANGLFADTALIALDGVNTAVPGGWIEHNYKQLYIQFAYVCACCAYVFDGEILGMDDDQIGEFVQDFVEVRRDFDSWNAPASGANGLHQRSNGHDIAAGDRHGVPDHSARDEPRAKYVPETSSGSHNEKVE
ncbi:Ammonium transporter [Rhizoctonia solani]|uniref:Ammonium transporter n=1 Tax=Rhizoctonia solani TaxID=456999 RepID=A0A8H7M0T3_9AGAM|nr:Ammonium transporter [Rhizoctonia solani]